MRLLDRVASGQRLGSIRGLDGEIREDIVAARDGVVGMLRGVPCVWVGDPLVSILADAGYKS